jgi:nucleoside-diphosphate-sugar epimerase
MHTILGAGGPVGNSLTKELVIARETVRLVSRKQIQTLGDATWVGADLKNYEQVEKAVKGSTVIYMCAGLQYNKNIWAKEWPLIMQNVIDATKTTGARLIFFDNVYMYGRVNGSMTEDTPYKPASVKGEIRARIADQLMSESREGNINGTIARAADFYGAETLNSVYDSMVLSRYAKKQKAMWLGKVNTKHSFTYVPDTGKALYMLAKDPQSGSQVWHLPTAPARTGIEFIQLAARIFNVKPEYRTINKLMLNAIGLFNKLIGETAEMYYQYQYDYIFSSAKFENRYAVKPTSYEEGVKNFASTLFNS